MIISRFPIILAEKKLRVADVVRATRMSKSTLHKLYNDESSRIDFNTIDQLCEFLDVQVGDLFVYKPNTKDDDEES
ncbi:helix-turn-helix domain-containing protein [Psychrobacter fulvigenes]|uniref:helix-turn-helix domain-containing protein n=1 Tax=Psychrobacter fulvigenes TaxID=533323 RepID=UPI001919B5A4|nr:helix-turn-helix transcriptional regulator [Psychrobacter fulvigenes]